MKILYGYTNCTNKKYYEIFAGRAVSALLADQKYHSLLIEGLAKNGAKVSCVSGLPINRNVTKKLVIHEPNEEENGIEYHYIRTINLPILRQLCIYFGTKKFVKRHCKRNEKDIYLICDCLNLANAYASLRIAKQKRIPLIYVITDIPKFQRGKLLSKINDQMISAADGFIFLTEQMNEKLNPKNRPYIVLEGHSDASLEALDPSQRYEFIDGKRVILYAGSLKKIYGIQNLVEGFLQANLENAELRIYGDGDYRDELERICKTHPNVRYLGIRPNQEIVLDEQRAALLVNPRPSAPEYTKYSFPSKTMEYMVSGTPVLMTKLPGMPEEYSSYVDVINDETSDGIANALKVFFESPDKYRYGKGARAREFVLKEKSNVVQTKKIIGFLRNEIGQK